ncbi:glycerol-3-phosphate 1-O-acyltransferase PlsY [Ramlibacter rhizophilus]|uniref:Glycerol-3-phosphate acyltransferase n=1 Tax=Ramlibacter rhizophilus TaxID=1781167 RepID=A0A4Z0BKV1_9BURK|nr:glycerol-3-phosphate 1-O-acyltransferase PlsY [Ramlibacter rhizophilus]TFY99952.1 glycerol-3-phosphate 1-O-acyltransferase PlsY [Ramlibacter rhizophilus]
MPYLLPLLAAVAAYLLGSLAFAVIVSRLMGLSDPRSFGSGNPGATNVLRSGSKPAALITLLLDAGKGLVPVLLVKAFGAPYGLESGTVGLVAVAAFLGHLYPVFFRFQGGKGVATFLGAVFGIDWLLGLATGLTWLIIAFFFRYSSLASLVAAVFAPAYFLLGDRLAWQADAPLVMALVVMGLLLIWRHRANIDRLLKGTESRLGAKKAR